MTTRLILVRHGETDWSRLKRYCSFTDVDLNKSGAEQARLVSKRLSKEKIHKVYSSGMQRSLQFARVVFKDSFIEIVPELKEMNFGVFEGLTHAEIIGIYPEIYKRWLDDPFDVVIPEGESLACFKDRVEKAITQLVSINEGRALAVVTHAGPIKIIISRLMKTENIWGVNPALASVSIIEFKNGTQEVKLFNDRSHINE